MASANALYGTSYDSLCDGPNSFLADAAVVHYAWKDKPWNRNVQIPPVVSAPWREAREKAKDVLSAFHLSFGGR